jgi:formylglycine-generating enzyme required for sulfatase activity
MLVMTGALVVGCGGSSGSSDGGKDAGSDRAVVELGPIHSVCPTALPGPALVRVGWNEGVAFCIDSTEVTNEQYQAFLTAAATKPPTQGERCQWNSSFAPDQATPGCPAFDPVGRANFPVVCVDWCDADAYCRASGKYLCRAGSRDGNNAGPVTNPLVTGGSQWVIACSSDGAQDYPYGKTGMPGVCVDKKYVSNIPGVQQVMSATACQVGATGIYDMSGNASEWQDDCVAAATTPATPADLGKTDECDAYGGAVSSEYSDTSCTAAASTTDTLAHFTRSQVAGDNGFRCCADAQFL